MYKIAMSAPGALAAFCGVSLAIGLSGSALGSTPGGDCRRLCSGRGGTLYRQHNAPALRAGSLMPGLGDWVAHLQP